MQLLFWLVGWLFDAPRQITENACNERLRARFVAIVRATDAVHTQYHSQDWFEWCAELDDAATDIARGEVSAQTWRTFGELEMLLLTVRLPLAHMEMQALRQDLEERFGADETKC